MAVISSITAKLTLDTTQFSTRLQRSRRRLRNFGRSVARNAKRVAGLGAAAGLAAVVGIAALTSHHLKAIDASGKFARSIGIETEQLVGLRHAAALGGVEQDKFDKSLSRMVRNIGEATQGLGTGKVAFDELGLSVDALAQMSPDEQMATIADALGGVENQTQKAALAYQIFGRSGIDLLNVIGDGSEAMREAAIDAEHLGLTYSNIDAEKVAEANNQIARLKARATSVAQTFAIELSPFIAAAAKELTGMGLEGESASDIVVNGIEFMAKGVAFAADTVSLLKFGFKTLQSAATWAIAGIVKGLNGLVIGANKVAEVLGFEGVDNSFLEEFGNELADTAATLFAEAEDAAFAWAEGDAAKKVEDTFNRIRINAQKAAEEMAAGAAAQEGGVLGAEALADEVERQLESQGKITDTLAKMHEELDRFGLSQIDIKIMDLEELGATVDQLTEARQTLEQIERLKNDQQRRDDISSILDDLERDVSLFGLSEEERTLLDLEALGASDEAVERAKAAIAELARLRGETTERAIAENRLLRVGSAESQRLAFQAGRNGARPDPIPQQQLEQQRRMVEVLENINDRGSSFTVPVEEEL